MYIEKIISLLKKRYPTTYLSRVETPFRVLISTVLSQRTRDENTEKASNQLFKVYKTNSALAKAPVKKVERLIKPSGFYKIKAKRIVAIAKDLELRFNGQVPDKLDDLLSLYGVGRKTANCVLVYAFRKPAIPVDTHVHRISNLIGWVKTKTPEQTELRLMKLIPRKYWILLNELLVTHGQNICIPRNPRCETCPISPYCDYCRKKLILRQKQVPSSVFE
ncbi:MAG: endonuclease III [Candidatus Woesearchaeota archaeon]